ncbi:MAG: hypothetical protein M1536_02040, partial [Firmicutes bacterium]|nr:hypothetical protein [Bacillota bacterium]
MKILQAPILALYQPYSFSRALRKLGHTADYMIWDTGGFEWLSHGWDYNLEIYKEDNQRRGILGWKKAEKDLFSFFLKALLKYDVFHFHSGFSLFPVDYFRSLPGSLDLKILKGAGKKIFFHHWGCRDSRPKSSFARECPELCSICPANHSGLCNDE